VVSRIIAGTTSISNEDLVRWARATRAGREKAEELLQLHEQAVRIGAAAIPGGSEMWSFSYTLVQPSQGPPYLGLVINQAELRVPDPDPAVVAEHRRQLTRIAAEAMANEPSMDAADRAEVGE
jgi:hypothetical protein